MANAEITLEEWLKMNKSMMVGMGIRLTRKGNPYIPLLDALWKAGVTSSADPIMDREIKRFNKLRNLLEQPWAAPATEAMKRGDWGTAAKIFIANGVTQCPSCDGKDSACPINVFFDPSK